MTPTPEPTWQPIQQLPLLARMVDGILANSQEQHPMFLAARERPHVLDDATVDRAARLYQSQLDDLWLYEEQARRWLALSLTASQRTAVERMAGQVARIREVSEAILALLVELREGTINRIMELDDEELGRQILTGRRKPPQNR